jgi:hypothetical protein
MKGPRRRIHLRSFLITVAIVGTVLGLLVRVWNELQIAGAREQARELQQQAQRKKEGVVSFYLDRSHSHSLWEKMALDAEQIIQGYRKQVGRLSDEDSRNALNSRIDELETGLAENAVWHSALSRSYAQVAADPSKAVNWDSLPPKPMNKLDSIDDFGTVWDRILEIQTDLYSESAADLELRMKVQSGSVSRFLQR